MASFWAVYDRILVSALPFPELTQCVDTDGRDRVDFQLRTTDHWRKARPEWVHEWQSGTDQPPLRYGKADGFDVLSVPGVAQYWIEKGDTVTALPAITSTPDALRHGLLNHVLPRLLSRAGDLVVHGSLVQTPYGGIIFAAESGGGKSTLAAAFWRQGCPALADDSLLLRQDGGRLIGVPSYPGIRLAPETARRLFGAEVHSPANHNGKIYFRCPTPHGAGGGSSTNIRAIYFLSPRFDKPDRADRIELARASPATHGMRLLANTFQLNPACTASSLQTLDKCVAVATGAPIRTLIYAPGFEYLDDIVQTILLDLRRLSEGIDFDHAGTEQASAAKAM
jgi:hypothetical protein